MCIFLQSFVSSFFLSATGDEYPHIESGYSALVTRDFRMETEHPPLLKVWSALPLLLLKLNFPINHESWAKHDHFTFYKQFIFEANKASADIILYVARIPMMFIGIMLLTSIFYFCNRKWNSLVALFSVFIVVFDPNILAQSNLVMTDLGFTLFCFLYITSLYQYLEKSSARNLIITVVFFSLAQLTKFTAVFLGPLTVVILILNYFFHRSLIYPLKKSVIANNFILIIALVFSGALFINAAYLFSHSFNTLEQDFKDDNLIDKTIYNPNKLITNQVLQFIFSSLPIPLPYNYI